jgi:asparagine synthase (glutamine-hydrolysing)
MCGISAIYQRQPTPVAVDDLTLMSSMIAHRGPDEAGYAIVANGQLGLAHVRLSIRDLAQGQQPMFSRDQQIVLSYNGEIYDVAAHRARLQRLGYQFDTHSDTEVVLYLYHAFGLDFVHHLNGEFALVLWDAAQQRLVATRDRTGIKPLFYYEDAKEIIFCSEAKGILALPRRQRELSREFFLSTPFAFQRQGISSFAGIASLKPGHMMIVDAAGSRQLPYWQADFQHDTSLNFADAQQQVQQLFHQAVQRRLAADVPIGAYLSGGLDSTLTCASMAAQHGPFPTFNLSYHNTAYDEAPLARQIADFYGLPFHSLPCSHDDLAHALEHSIYQSELLPANPGHVGKFILARFARQHGVKVCLTGEGADELFAGYAYFKQEALWQMQLAGGTAAMEAEQLMPQFTEQASRSRNLSWTSAEHWRSAKTKFGYPNNKEIMVSNVSNMVAAQLYHPDFIATPDPMALLYQSLPASIMAQLSPLNASRLSALHTLSEYIIPLLGDRAEMAASLECRPPFLDNDLIAFAHRLPAAYLLDMAQLREKYLLHAAFAADLPPFMQQQHKHPFSSEDWSSFYLKSDYAKQLMLHHLSDADIRQRGIFNPAYVASMRKLWQGLPAHSPMRQKIQSTIGVMVCSQILHQQFIQQRPQPAQWVTLTLRRPATASRNTVRWSACASPAAKALL